MTTSHVIIVGWKGEEGVVSQIPCILKEVDIEVNDVHKLFINVEYYGTITEYLSDKPYSVYEELLTKIQEHIDMESDDYKDYTSMGLILDNTVLFMDMLTNFDDYTDHPMTAIGKAYILREKLDNLFTDRKLTYFKQCISRINDEIEKYKKRQEQENTIKVQFELLKMLK